jgi:methyl-accepting chemotaxis protein
LVKAKSPIIAAQVAKTAEEKSKVTHEVSKNMSAINEIVGELDNKGKQVFAEFNNINDINQQLTKIISRFKV